MINAARIIVIAMALACGVAYAEHQDQPEIAESKAVDEQARLGYIYYYGRQGERDTAAAAGWLRLAAKNGHARAQALLGSMYLTGEGVQRDFAEAVHWLRASAEQGYERAQMVLPFAISVMYMLGEGVEQDYVVAHAWAEVAAAEFEPATAVREEIAALMTREQIVEARSMAGYQHWLIGAKLVLDTTNTARDYAKAIRRFQAAAELGEAWAQVTLGLMYSVGEVVPLDEIEAVRWFRAAAEQGDAEGKRRLGTMYADGRGVTKDYAVAIRWLRAAAEQGNADAQTSLGRMYAEGLGVRRSLVDAGRWYRTAAEQGHVGGQVLLGELYSTGQGVPQDYVIAYAWLNIAGAQSMDARRDRDQLAELMTAGQIGEAQRTARDLWERIQDDRESYYELMALLRPTGQVEQARKERLMAHELWERIEGSSR